jgi:hypothetical protein
MEDCLGHEKGWVIWREDQAAFLRAIDCPILGPLVLFRSLACLGIRVLVGVTHLANVLRPKQVIVCGIVGRHCFSVVHYLSS